MKVQLQYLYYKDILEEGRDLALIANFFRNFSLGICDSNVKKVLLDSELGMGI